MSAQLPLVPCYLIIIMYVVFALTPSFSLDIILRRNEGNEAEIRKKKEKENARVNNN